jgi:FkbM family methyltransferase
MAIVLGPILATGALRVAQTYFAKVPIRNTYLKLCNRLAKGGDFASFLRRYKIDVVLDVGANNGQYGRQLIRSGFRGQIVSFEPLPTALEKLRMNRWSFASWAVEPFALGADNGTATLNVSANTQSSSLQPMLQAHVTAAPSAKYVSTCEVQVRRLDDIFDQYCQPGQRCCMKLDVQGHEHQVLAGAAKCLDRITIVQMELSIEPLYEGAETWQASIESMRQLGYKLMLLTPGFRDHQTGEMMQADGVFVRYEAVEQVRKECA